MFSLRAGEENIAYLPQVRALHNGLDQATASAALLKTSLTGGAAQPTSAPAITAPSNVLDYGLGSLEIGDFKDRVAYPPSAFIEETQALEGLVSQHAERALAKQQFAGSQCRWLIPLAVLSLCSCCVPRMSCCVRATISSTCCTRIAVAVVRCR